MKIDAPMLRRALADMYKFNQKDFSVQPSGNGFHISLLNRPSAARGEGGGGTVGGDGTIPAGCVFYYNRCNLGVGSFGQSSNKFVPPNTLSDARSQATTAAATSFPILTAGDVSNPIGPPYNPLPYHMYGAANPNDPVRWNRFAHVYGETGPKVITTETRVADCGIILSGFSTITLPATFRFFYYIKKTIYTYLYDSDLAPTPIYAENTSESTTASGSVDAVFTNLYTGPDFSIVYIPAGDITGAGWAPISLPPAPSHSGQETYSTGEITFRTYLTGITQIA